jgi:hydrogenase-4 component J
MTDITPAGERVVFYQLSRKFVQEGQAPSAQSKQLIHYTLAIGHHIGVIDCFKSALEIPLDDYRDWLAQLPPGEGRRKLEGLLRFGEIEISWAHAAAIREALRASEDVASETRKQLSARLAELLLSIDDEPALYLMVRRRR